MRLDRALGSNDVHLWGERVGIIGSSEENGKDGYENARCGRYLCLNDIR